MIALKDRENRVAGSNEVLKTVFLSPPCECFLATLKNVGREFFNVSSID